MTKKKEREKGTKGLKRAVGTQDMAPATELNGNGYTHVLDTPRILNANNPYGARPEDFLSRVSNFAIIESTLVKSF